MSNEDLLTPSGGPTYQQPRTQGAAPQRRREPDSGKTLKGCLLAFVLVLVLGVVCVVGVVGMAFMTAASSIAGMPMTGGGVPLQEVTLRGSALAPKIACIPVRGILTGNATQGAELSPAALFAARLDRAASDPDVQAVILYVDSPGGGITASDIMHQSLLRFRDDKGVPVVACVLDVAASGGYYVAVGADTIIAHPTSITGSIGVRMPLFDMSSLMKKLGIQDRSVNAGEFKDIGSPFAEKTAEQWETERALLKTLIDEMHEVFIKVVADGRNLKLRDVREVADGRIFTSSEALKHGLIDQIGYEEDAIRLAMKTAAMPDAQLIEYQRVFGFSDIFGGLAQGPNVNITVGAETPARMQSRPMFLWSPAPAPTNEE